MAVELAKLGALGVYYSGYPEWKLPDRDYVNVRTHCVASKVVADQLAARGIPHKKIWTVPYGADERIFRAKGGRRPRDFCIAFAGQICLRKGMKTLLDALTQVGRPDWQVHFFGGDSGETAQDFANYR